MTSRGHQCRLALLHLQVTLHNPVRDVLYEMLVSVYGTARVLREPEEHAVYSPAARPDLVVLHARGPGRR